MKRAWYIGLTLNVLLLVSLLAGGAWYFNRPATAETEVVTPTAQLKPPEPVEKIDYFNRPDLDKDKLYPLISIERVKAGLAPLTVNPLLEQSACAKAQHMVDNKYWAHYAPDGTTPWYFMHNVGYIYDKAGENLLYGAYSEEKGVKGWMNSPSHKVNILGTYVETGICVINDVPFQEMKRTNIVVQHFGTQ
jgi:uncharacterized protein YkwD